MLGRVNASKRHFESHPEAPAATCGIQGTLEGTWLEGGSEKTSRPTTVLSGATTASNSVPEVVEHRIGWRVPIVGAPMHLAAGDDIDTGDFLLQYGRLGSPQLGVGKIPRERVARR